MTRPTRYWNDRIFIMTDARHNCRKDSYHTDHLAIDQLKHKIVDPGHITKADDHCSQRHETFGCDVMYRDFDKLGIEVVDHTHDRNMSINGRLKTRETNNSNDRWHVTKGISSAIKKISIKIKARH